MDFESDCMIVDEDKESGELSGPSSPVPEGDDVCEVQHVTRVRLELGTNDSDDGGGLGFAIDRLGQDGDTPTAPQESDQGDDDDDGIEVVGAVSGQPSSSKSMERNRIHPAKPDFNRTEHQPPIYNVEDEMVITNVRSLATEIKSEGPKGPPKRKKNVCWNCEGDHMITNCPEPRDGQRIGANRQKFMAAGRSGGGGGSGGGPQGKRYHEEEESKQTLLPGELSEDLRYVLGLGPRQLPVHIYRMRVYGYPPGWLEHAMDASSSGLKWYGNDTIMKEIGSRKKAGGIDKEKIISYPGFNVPPPPGTRDESREIGCPRFSSQHSLENMIRDLGDEDKVEEAKPGRSSSPPQPWNFNASGLDERSENQSGRVGIGRGREVRSVSKRLQNEPMPKTPDVPFRNDNRGFRRVEEVVEVDPRYLPRKSGAGQKRARSGRSSPSLLRGGGGGVSVGGPESPVILNLPPTNTNSSNNATGRRHPNHSDTGSETGSSGDMMSVQSPCAPPATKKRRVGQESEEEDDCVLIIDEGRGDEEEEEKTSDKSSDSIQILDNNPELGKETTKTNKETTIITTTIETVETTTIISAAPKPPAEVVDLDLESDNDDYAQNRVGNESPGSSTDDEPLSTSNKPKKSKLRKAMDEDWEEEEEGGGVTAPVPAPAPTANRVSPKPKEFVPAHPRLMMCTNVLLANRVEEEEEEVSVVETFGALPAQEKFAQGMPEMVFEEEPPERTGRLDRVLHVLKKRRRNGYNTL